MRRLLAVVVGVLALSAAPAAATEYADPAFQEDVLVEGLNQPTGMAFVPGGRIIVVEKQGTVQIAPAGSSTPSVALDLSDRVNEYADHGLLGVAVDSQFATHPYVYLLYTLDAPGTERDTDLPATARLSRFRLTASSQLVEEEVLLGTSNARPCPAPSNTIDCIPSDGRTHSIGTVRSASDGTLYVGAGDAADDLSVNDHALRSYAEQSLAGKILRITREGRGVAAHPFCPQSTNLENVCAKIWAKGLRNPFRFALIPEGGLVLGDVGWQNQEELDVIREAGRSLGWPCYEGRLRTPGYRDRAECQTEYETEPSPHTGPDLTWNHEQADGSFVSGAALGGPLYAGTSYPAAYRGNAFYGDYGARFMRRALFDSQGAVTGSAPFATDWLGLDIQTEPATGDVVYVDPGDFRPAAGAVKRIFYNPDNAIPVAAFSATPQSATTPPLAVQFDASGSSDSDGDDLTYTWDFDDFSPRVTTSTPTTSHTFTGKGRFRVRLEVSDGQGGRRVHRVPVDVGVPPSTPAITGDATYRAGEPIELHGAASDEGTPLGREAFEWQIELIHIDHVHPLKRFYRVANPNPDEIVGPTDHDADSYLRVTLTATDADGLTTTVTKRLDPETAAVRLRSEPAGAPLSYAGRTVEAPFDTQSPIGFKPTVTAPLNYTRGMRRYQFVRWADEETERVRTLEVLPEGAELTAVYEDITPPTASLPRPEPKPKPKPPPKLTPPKATDEAAPTVAFSPRRGLLRRRTLRGRVLDVGGLEELELAVGRRVRKGCRWLSSAGRLGRPRRRCAAPRWLEPRLKGLGGGEWTYRVKLPRTLRPGRYRLVLKATDRAGNVTEKAFSLRVRRRRPAAAQL